MTPLRPGQVVYYGDAIPEPEDTTADRGVVSREHRRTVVTWFDGAVDEVLTDGFVVGIGGWAIPVPRDDTLCCLPVRAR